MTRLHIKNMVCPRCILAIERTLEDLGIKHLEICLGKVILNEPMNEQTTEKFKKNIEDLGFELLEDKNASLINQIKSILIQNIHSEQNSTRNFSEILSHQLNKDYAQLSKLFSSNSGTTIEQFIIHQKIERVKELLTYDQLSLKEIALMMNYSSPAHLSAQFKKNTGWTPTAYKKLNEKSRNCLDIF